ncbi:hypothetical protein K493DRAFT_298764 [Basidiobolus meristosporus CBS 931.73]|uniref:Uncharacterized protein n=1 Tax=Basidiobolus meristosporus CBS 931.73 TaxID=1314790 RepID=A0A1Y1YSA3_9FUNG|nr:hypothetical protein K493DRAFT_298764 [Basidiobolus meristosporus CBS 931.73]|eukprot:ORY00704.1 hypothetical protein K493DRAFT_298764 [Basidiobolus meristosporus CBS 931.73]
MNSQRLSRYLADSQFLDSKHAFIQEWVQQQSKLAQSYQTSNREDDNNEEPLPPIAPKRKDLVGSLKTKQGSIIISSSRKKRHRERKEKNRGHQITQEIAANQNSNVSKEPRVDISKASKHAKERNGHQQEKAGNPQQANVSRLAFSESRFLNGQSLASTDPKAPAKNSHWRADSPQERNSDSTEIMVEEESASTTSKSLGLKIDHSGSQHSCPKTRIHDELVPDSQPRTASTEKENNSESVMILQVDGKLRSKWNTKSNPALSDKEQSNTKDGEAVQSEGSNLSPSLLLLMEECEHGEILSPARRSAYVEADKLDVLLAEISSGSHTWDEEWVIA